MRNLKNWWHSLAIVALGFTLAIGGAACGNGDGDGDAGGADSTEDVAGDDVADRDVADNDSGDKGGDDAGMDAEDDGGGNQQSGWRSVDPPIVENEARFSDVHFVDESHGWLTIRDEGGDGGVYATEDGGETWDLRHDSSVDATAVYRGSDTASVFVGGDTSANYFLWISENGNSFDPVRPDDVEYNQDVDNLVMIDDTHGLYTGDTSGSRILVTGDGGASWQTVSVNTDAGSNGEIELSGNDVWIAAGQNNSSAGVASDEGAILMHSDDRGKAGTWEDIKFTDEVEYKGEHLRGVYIADAAGDDIWTGGKNRQLYHTEDGGANWNQISDVPDELRTIESIDGAGDKISIAATTSTQGDGDYAIYHSEDGGNSWEIAFTSQQDRFLAIEYAGPNYAVAYPGDGDPGGWVEYRP